MFRFLSRLRSSSFDPVHERHSVRPAFAAARRHTKTAVVALAITGAAVFAVLAARGPSEGHAVLVTNQPVPGGSVVDPRTAQLVLLPREAVPDDALTSEQELGETIATRDIPARTVLTGDLLIDKGTFPSGYSQVTLPLPAQADGILGGESVEIWGPAEDCLETSCPIRLLTSNATVRRVSYEEQGLLSSPTSGSITLILQSAAIPSVIRASEVGSLYFVVSSPEQHSWERQQ